MTDVLLATFPYADGVIAVAGTGVYFSDDCETFIQVNRDTYVAQTDTVTVGVSPFTAVVADVAGAFTTEYTVGDHIRINGEIRQIASITDNDNLTVETGFSAAHAAQAHYKNGTTTPTGTVAPRTSQGQSMIAYYEGDSDYGTIAITDTTGNNNACVFKITGSGAGRKYFYDDLDADFAAPLNPRYCAAFQNRLILANSDDGRNAIAWGDRFDFGRFDGASAGTAEVDGDIVTIYPFKDLIIIFCRSTIHQLQGLDTLTGSEPTLLPVTSRTGCAATFSVQEVGNDLLFLADDGIRTISATDAYGDLTFGVVSRKIDPIIREILQNLNSYTFSSTYRKTKNQYRLYYTSATTVADDTCGLIGTRRLNQAGELSWEWSETAGIIPSCMDSTSSTFNSADEDSITLFGGYDGYIYTHDVGSDFDGDDIAATLELNEIDYGDMGMKKTLHYVRVLGNLEGTVDEISMDINYDFSSAQTAQPSAYALPASASLAVYGSAVYGTDAFGGNADFGTRILVSGSGYSNDFHFSSTGTGDPYNLESLYVDLRVGALL